jgi:hypothetical protein
VGSRLKIFLEDALGLANCFERQFLIGHNVISLQSVSRPNEVMSQMVPFRSIGLSKLSHLLESGRTSLTGIGARLAQ